MVAGPWFTVRDDSGEWQDFGTVWWSNGGAADGMSTLQLRLKLEGESAPNSSVVEVADAG